MNFRKGLRDVLKLVDNRLGLRAWLSGEPSPPPGGFDLEGEKLLDWAWVVSNLSVEPQNCLDIGCAQSPIVPIMVFMGHTVTGVDMADMPYDLDRFTSYRGDFNDVPFNDLSYDVVVLCSVVEHIGLAGRYGVTRDDPDGDLRAMCKVSTLLKPDGVLILTIPLGQDGVHAPWHRVYGRRRLPRLLEGYRIERTRFFVKAPHASWRETDESTALDFQASAARYALGQYLLRKATV